MTENRIYNFNAGPAALPLPVLEEIRENFLNYDGSGMSVIELSHRSAWFDKIINDAEERIKRLLGLDDRFHVIFVQGGASMQFAMIPMNFLPGDSTADFVNTGTWSTKAVKEAELLKKNISTVASSEDRNFCYIPKDIKFNSNASFVHLTSNNTIKGTQYHDFPDTGNVPIVCDMSSDIMSRKLPVDRFGMIYAGAQKNAGPSGAAVVIIRKDMLDLIPEGIPSMLDYRTYVNKQSMYNTPPCFAVYTIQLVMKWLEEEIGGLDKMQALNEQKAAILYDMLDQGDFYNATADHDSRSLMNVTFRLPTEKLEALFVEEALKAGLGGLKGHRSVGGCRASIYNAATVEGLETLVQFMKEFEAKRG